MSRRFLQARRRGPFLLSEITRLLHRDATYVETVRGEPWTIIGANAIAEILQDLWRRRGDEESMQIVRLGVTGDTTSVGHWRRVTATGEVVFGRDLYTVRDGLITRVEVEEFERATPPRLILA